MHQVSESSEEFVDVQRDLLHEQLAAAWQLHIERVEEQLRTGWQAQLGRVVEERFNEFKGRFENEVQTAIGVRSAEQDELAAAGERLKWSAQLSQIARRLDQAEDMPAWCAALLDGALTVAPRAFLFSLLSGEIAVEGVRTSSGEIYPALDGLKIPLSGVPAFGSAAQSLDTVIAMALPGEISETLVTALAMEDGGKLAILPVVTERGGKERHASALLVIPGHEPPANLAALELLTSIAGLALDVRQMSKKLSQPGVGAQMLGIAPNAEPKMPVSVVPDVAKLPLDEQEMHARAQRFARVKIAEMRLYHAQAVKEGRENHNLYGALRGDVDQDREQFQREYMATPTMIDYFHVELVRTLANDDPTMLGPDYPGPLA
jgi:hypothetical protein